MAAELSIMYPVKQIAPCIPAFAYVETFSYRRGLQKEEAVKQFFKWSKTCKELYPTEEDQEMVFWVIDQVYWCLQTFAEWNFWNLTRSKGYFDEIETMLYEARVFAR